MSIAIPQRDAGRSSSRSSCRSLQHAEKVARIIGVRDQVEVNGDVIVGDPVAVASCLSAVAVVMIWASFTASSGHSYLSYN